MKVKEVIETINGQLMGMTSAEQQEKEVDYAYGCDLMSDVLAFVTNNVILLTGLVHLQVIKTAEMLDIPVIVFVRGKKPTEDIVEMANQKGITVITTTHSLFTASGLLFQAGMKGEEITHDGF